MRLLKRFLAVFALALGFFVFLGVVNANAKDNVAVGSVCSSAENAALVPLPYVL